MSVVPSFDTTSLEDLVALAQAQGLHVEDETDRDHVVGLVQASVVADLAEGEVTGGRDDASAAAAAAPASPADERLFGGDGADGGGGGGGGGAGGGGPSSTPSPPRHLSPMSFGSPLPGAPPPQRLSDILALDGMMGRPSHGDASSSVCAEVGSRTGRGGGGGGGGGAGGGASGGGGDSDMEASSSSHSSYSTAAGVNAAATAAAAAAAAAGPAGGGGGGAGHPGGSGGGADETLTDERREALETFMAFTQVGSSVSAAQFLDATDWSPDAAINLFLESGGDTAAVAAAPPPPQQRGVDAAAAAGAAGYGAAARSGGARGWPRVGGAEGYGDGQSDDDYNEDGADDHDDVGANPFSALGELPGLMIPPPPAGGAAGRSPPPQQQQGGGGGGGAAGGGGGSPGEQDHLYPGGFSEDGVRAPIPARTDRLIGGGGTLGGVGGGGGGGGGAGMMLGGMLGGAMGGAGRSSVEEKDNTDWIFKVPEGLSFPSDFLETRQICKEQKKWLMVNIQDHQEFASHRLNKDVWSNETILTLLRGNFIFWQRNKALRQARYYVDKYNLEGEVLPHTAILDPRTGAQLLKVVGFVEPEDLSMALVEFLENNSIDQVKAPAVKTIGLGNIAHHGYNQTPGKGYGGGVSERTSPDNSVGMYSGGRGGGRGDASLSRDSAYESFGSEEYVYEDDDDLAQGSSFDGDDNSTTNSHASPGYHPQTTTPNAKPSPPATTRSSSPSPPTVAGSGRSSPSRPSAAAATGGGGEGKSATAAGASSAATGAGLVGPWGRGTPEDDLRAEGGGGEEALGGAVEVPQEPDAGNGVTQVQFRLAGGGTIARRFWLKDRVSLLFQFVRTTGEEAATRPFDLLSGHPPSSLLGSKVSTLEAANLSNSAIMVRWL